MIAKISLEGVEKMFSQILEMEKKILLTSTYVIKC